MDVVVGGEFVRLEHLPLVVVGVRATELDAGVAGRLHRPRELHELRRVHPVSHGLRVGRIADVGYLDTLVLGPLGDIHGGGFEACELLFGDAVSDVVDSALTDALGDVHVLVDRVVVHLLFEDVGRRVGEFLAENQAFGFGVDEVTGEPVNIEFEPRGAKHPDAGDGFVGRESTLKRIA